MVAQEVDDGIQGPDYRGKACSNENFKHGLLRMSETGMKHACPTTISIQVEALQGTYEDNRYDMLNAIPLMQNCLRTIPECGIKNLVLKVLGFRPTGA